MSDGHPRVVASIEARMTSSRLPGKVLADVHGAPALARLVRRLKRCASLDGIVLATTVNRDDDPLEALASAEGIACHRGSEEDVLLRVVEAHRKMKSEVIVEVTGDATLLDPAVIELGVATFLSGDIDVVSNTWHLTYPQGADVQVFRLSDLEAVEREVADPAVREHVSLFFYEHPERYRIHHLVAPPELRRPDLRFQLDYPEDLAFIREVYGRLGPVHGDGFGTAEILHLLAEHPAIAALNRDCVEKAVR